MSDLRDEQPIQTGDEIKLTVATLGRDCKVEVNGTELPRMTHFRIEAEVRDITKLDITLIHPWPPVAVNGKRSEQTFTGYFVERADWEAFDAWRKGQDEAGR
jgi:hypothetical protein